MSLLVFLKKISHMRLCQHLNWNGKRCIFIKYCCFPQKSFSFGNSRSIFDCTSNCDVNFFEWSSNIDSIFFHFIRFCCAVLCFALVSRIVRSVVVIKNLPILVFPFVLNNLIYLSMATWHRFRTIAFLVKSNEDGIFSRSARYILSHTYNHFADIVFGCFSFSVSFFRSLAHFLLLFC